MPFVNRIRIPMQLHSAQFPEERQVFRKANGVTKTLSVTVRKTYELETDYLPEMMHQKLKIALAHDNISWEGDHFLGDISQDGDYSVQWPDGVLHYPAAKAECKVQVTPFDATNSNCQTCQEASQLDLQDDTITGIYGALQENRSYFHLLADNDIICCYPAVFSLTSFNSDYLDSAAINPTTGLISFHTGTGLVAANGMLIATYRVTCPNGNYDEANVYADISGSIPGCLAPLDLVVLSQGPDSITYQWDAPFLGADYYWEIYEGTSPVGPLVQAGNISVETITVSGLDSDTDYYFQIRTVCYGSVSNYVGIASSTIPQTAVCGRYRVQYSDGTLSTSATVNVQYRDCNSVLQSTVVFNQSFTIFCALQTSPGFPVYIQITAVQGTSLQYLGSC